MLQKFRGRVLLIAVIASVSFIVSAAGTGVGATSSAERVADPILTSWIINSDGHVNPHWPTLPVNVQSATQIAVNGIPYAQVRTNRIPDYYTNMTASLIQELNGRPRAATDFRLGHTTATEGQMVRFGDDIGYSTTRCVLGYWPPGPSCPTAQSITKSFPMQPIFATQATSTTLGATGLWVDGAAVYNWSDGMSYGNGGVWQNTAMSFEQYDMDICPGHAPPTGDYHHHSYADCLAQLVGDTGQAHSPIYGFALDGFPIYGPWEANGVLVESGWKTRNYDDPASPTGCGVAHVRNCTLRNPLDYTQGTVPAAQTGPRTDSNVTTQSGNVISATSGIYLQDYWYDNSCTTCLDAHNGHDTGDGRGYHYHVTVRINPSGGRLIPTFPYTFGPTYAGQLSPAVTYTPTPTQTAPATFTPTFTPTPTPSSTSTSTPTASLLVGHVSWQGPPAQPNSAQQQPITLTLKSGATEINYPSATTDASGFFTVSVGSQPPGLYSYRVKGPRYLANSGTVTLTGSATTQQEMGLLKAGDCNNDNVVNASDFTILRNSFGKSFGQSGYDDRADFDGNHTINASDFNLVRNNFGVSGAPPISPAGR